MKQVFFLFFLFCYQSLWAKPLNLEEILKHQNQDVKQSQWVQNKLDSEVLQNSVVGSPWLTEISSSLERKNSITETFTGAPDNVTDSLPWSTTVKQRTPYGLRLSLEYYKELDDPFFSNFFQDQRVRGSLEFSLLNDLFGKSSKTVLELSLIHI